MFGGDLKEHIDFVRGCRRDTSVEEVVELFLTKMQNDCRGNFGKQKSSY